MLKKKMQFRHEGSELKREHHKHGSRERLTTKPSYRPYENFSENFTSLNAKRANILRETYHHKLILEPSHPKRVNVVLGKDEGA